MRKDRPVRIRMSIGDLATRFACQLLCICFLLIFLIPIGYVLISSVSTNNGLSLSGYRLLMGNKLVLSGFKNSILLASIGTCYSLMLEIPLAYVLSKKEYSRLTNLLYALGQFGIAMLPLYLLLKKFGLLNSLWGLILPSAMSVFNTLQLRARMLTLSESFEDAASLDGCGPIRYLLQICIPVIGPTIGVFAFWHACGYWGNTLLANTILTDESKYPLTLVLNQLLIQNQTSNVLGTGITVSSIEAIQMAEFALCVISALPMIGLFMLIKRHIKAMETDGGLVL